MVTVLPFGWNTSPLIYHTVTEAVAMYVRSLGIPILCWIDDMLGTTEQALRGQDDAINGGSFPLSSFWLISNTFLVLKMQPCS